MQDNVIRAEIKSKYLSYSRQQLPDRLFHRQDEEIVFLDFEATGVDPRKDEIIEVGALRVKDFKIVEKYNTLVSPSISIPAYIEYTTKINDELVGGAPGIGSVFPKLMKFIGRRPVVAFADFERQFLSRYCRELLQSNFDNRYVDALELARTILPSLTSHRQVDIAGFFDIPVKAAHRAYDDVEVLLHLYQILLAGLLQLDRETVSRIASLSQETEWSLRELFKEVESSWSTLTGRPRATCRTDHHSTGDKMTGKTLSTSADSEFKRLDNERLTAVFAENGLLASGFDAFETRQEQLSMVLKCAEALNEKKHLVIEAGTGTGKSLAYLVPSIYFAVENGVRVIVSTKSINLQDQLFLKDIPFLQKVLDVGFRTSVLKGYGNYLCRRKFSQWLKESACLRPEQITLAAMVMVWMDEVDDGDVSRLNIHTDYGLWSSVCSSANSCLKKKCDWKKQRLCFYHQAREKARRSHLVIVNHSLLFENVRLGYKLLPPASHIVVDEAHAIEDEATEQLTGQLRSRRFFEWLDSLYHERGQRKTGFLLGVLRSLPKKRSAPANSALKAIECLFEKIQKVKNSGTDFFTAVNSLWEFGSPDDAYVKQEIRITPDIMTERSWESISLTGKELLDQLGEMRKELEQLYQSLAEPENKPWAGQEELMVDLSSHILALTETMEVTASFLKGFRPGMVCWTVLDNQADPKNVAVYVAPLEIGGILKERFFDQLDTVILTSATLTVAGSFDYLLSRLGLVDGLALSEEGEDDRGLIKAQLPSSFDFERQTKVLLVSDLEEPGTVMFERDLSGFIADIHRAAEGGVLTLFTNNQLMQKVYFAVLEPLANEGLIVFCQNVGASRQKITRDFLTDHRSSLFGTASFWEGFDASGDTLKCIIVTKLPFSRPDQPVIEARCEALEEKGMHPFDTYLLPQAALRLKQGVGRLIRTKTDKGLIVIADSRLCRKAYASQFFSVLPRCRHEIKTRSGIVEDITEWTQNSKNS